MKLKVRRTHMYYIQGRPHVKITPISIRINSNNKIRAPYEQLISRYYVVPKIRDTALIVHNQMCKRIRNSIQSVSFAAHKLIRDDIKQANN